MKSRASARTLEALIGSSIGAGAGAAGGALSYSPSSPLEWMDEHGEVQSRPLTEKEKSSKGGRARKAALMGAAAGAGGALGLSRVLRSLRTSAERSALKSGDLTKRYVGPLEDYAMDLTRRSPRQALLFPPKGAKPGDADRLLIAQDILKKRNSRIKELLSVAEQERNKAVFGGLKKHPGAKKGERVFSPSTHEGQIMHKIFGGPKAMTAFNKGPASGPFQGRGMRGSYEDLIERLYRQGRS